MALNSPEIGADTRGMPNWCQNYLEVVGPEETVTRFRTAVQVGMTPDQAHEAAELILAGTPHGADEVAALAQALEGDEYLELSFGQTVTAESQDERVARWGTKSDADEAMLCVREPGSAAWWFGTAWSPPKPWVETTAKMWPDLEFELVWCDSGYPFAGCMTAHGADVELRDFPEGAEARELAALGFEAWAADAFPADEQSA